MPNPIVVIGAGVSGLTSALLLSKSKGNVITVVAKHMPGDYDIEYASPFAGANFMPMSTAATSKWERRTWSELKRLVAEAPAAGIHFQKSLVFRRNQDIVDDPKGNSFDSIFARDPWYQDMFDDFRELAPEEVPEGYESGCEFGSVCMNVTIYLHWLLSECLKNGVVFKRAVLSHIQEARRMSHTGQDALIIVNCTGLGAATLGGVEDKELIPVRGQTVLVRNEATPMVACSGTEEGLPCYIMMRAAGGGTVIGGTYDKGISDPTPDPAIAEQIMKRAVKICPALTGGKGVEALDVIRHAVGLRPLRPVSGAHVALDLMKFEDDETAVVHNFGHAGWGYQGSYGCAEEVVTLVNKYRKQKGESLDNEPRLFSWDA